MTSENKVYVSRTFECNARELFSWLTDPTRIAQWFGPEGFTVGNVSNNLSEGGKYQIELKKDDMIRFTILGSYLTINAPNKLAFTYDYVGLENPPPPSKVYFDLKEIGPDQTELSMTQVFEIQTPDFATRTRAWNYMLDKLSRLVS